MCVVCVLCVLCVYVASDLVSVGEFCSPDEAAWPVPTRSSTDP